MWNSEYNPIYTISNFDCFKESKWICFYIIFINNLQLEIVQRAQTQLPKWTDISERSFLCQLTVLTLKIRDITAKSSDSDLFLFTFAQFHSKCFVWVCVDNYLCITNCWFTQTSIRGLYIAEIVCGRNDQFKVFTGSAHILL